MTNGWPRKRLDDIVTRLTNGYVGPTRNIYVESGVPYLLARHVRSNEMAFDGKTFITEEFNEKHKKSKLKTGDVLLVQSGHIGHSAVVPKAHAGHNCHAMIVITPVSSEVTGDFLSLYFNAPVMQEKFEEIRSGSTVPHLTCREVRELSIPVPPLAEQQRIVGILDEAFEGIATAKANAEKNLQNARALFESHLQSVFTQRGEGWVEKRLGDVAEVQSGGTPLVSEKAYWNGDIPWYSSGELNDLLTAKPNRHITTAGLENSNAKVFPSGSLLMGMYDTAALKMSILDRDAAFNQAIAGVKPNRDIDLAFVLFAINAVKPILLLQRRGVRQKNLSLAKIKDISVPMPRLSEQRSTVEQLQHFSEETQRLATIYESKLAALDDLKKSLLHEAFSGKL